MSHYAVIAPPFYSHLSAMQNLALALIARGHRITFFHQADVAAFIRHPAIEFYCLGTSSHPVGSLDRILQLAKHPTGLAMFSLIKEMAKNTALFCRELPRACKMLAVDGLIVDQMEPGGALAALQLGLPYVSVACALPLNREPGLPLAVMPFAYQQTGQAHQRYTSSEKIYDWCMRSHDQVIAEHARQIGLPKLTRLHHCFSSLAQISQSLNEFDFPRQQLPSHFHAVGPLRTPPAARQKAVVSASTRPTIFASLGTLQGHRYPLFKKLVAASRAIDGQLLLAHCGGLSAAQAARLAKTPQVEVVDFVDQPAALANAQLAITHGGMNTVLDSIEQLTPLLVVPLAFDQAGVAARVVHHGIGLRLSKFARQAAFSKQLSQLLVKTDYRTNMAPLRTALQQAGGCTKAALIVEQGLETGRPVLAGGSGG